MSAAKRQWDAQQESNAVPFAAQKGPDADFARLIERPMTSIKFDPAERKLVLDTCCGGASKEEADQLIAIAEMRGMNPLAGECYFVKRWDSQKRREVWAVQASIESFRIKAEESGLYDGQDEVEYEYEKDGSLKLARVRVYRKDWSRPAVGVARFSEYVQTTKEGAPTRFWKQMPHNQLGKCAEALAFRKAFPKRLAKVYAREEMMQADSASHDPETGEVRGTPEGREEERDERLGREDGSLLAFLNMRDAIEAASTLAELVDVWRRGTKGMAPAHKSELARRKDRKKAELTEAPPEREPGDDSDVVEGVEP